MLSDEEEEEENKGRRNFFSLSVDRHVNLLLPEAQGRRCWGSSHGWLITLGSDMDISLLNALARAQIDQLPQLPRFESFDRDNIKKIILSSKLSSTVDKNCKLMVLYSQSKILAVCSPGEKSWTTLESTIGQLSDVIYFEGMLYV
ncbi:hypothetical protein GIB67_030907 [Kingdonia uniflora]|uniref:KIB1-4 beta-propeller domain-containing protein n=1 Tax=Kingdonia uniflora TaxID=39325 RepID=A0A7J7L3H0_9MAGN|nr:hypothetical protein GIB67_030907 [Kingdonia uniflora]